MDSLVAAVEAADSGYAVVSIAIIGLYVLVWKYAGQLLPLLRANTAVTQEAHSEVKQISESIITNHGSKNLGDAIDRLTEWMLQHMSESRSSDEAFRRLRREVVVQIAQAGLDKELTTKMFAELDDRLARLEGKEE